MMLAAWGEGIGSCIATLHDEEVAKQVLGVPADHKIALAISFGYPAPGGTRMIEGQPLERVLARVGRKPLDEIVHWERY